MTEESKTSPTIHPGELVPPALGAFRVLIWSGVVLALIGVTLWLMQIAAAGQTYGTEADILTAGAGASFGLWAGLAVPLLAGAGIVAGLGKRQ